ncbi:MAG: ABC transporter substrate-binding protein [Clostridiales bacterium]|jgi:multiple sugar transport system substrate-binding protein|nr:ABC transporter substrate-binding protein [Clostridiales bacterium]
MKRSIGLLLILAVLLSSSACASGGSPAAAKEEISSQETENQGDASQASSEAADAKQTNLTYVTGADSSGTILEIIKAAQEEFPNVTIDLQEIPGNSDDIKKSLITSLAAGQDDPDIFSMDVIWTTQFASAGWLEDLTDKYDPALYLEGPLSTVSYGGKRWAVPDYTDVQSLFYRSDLIDEPPATWDDLVRLSEEHQGKDGIEWGVLFQAFQGEPIVCNSLTFIKSNGGEDIVGGEVKINSPQAKEALEFMRSLIDKGITSEEALSQKPGDQLPVFMEGKALFMLNWPGNYASLQLSPESKVVDKFSIAQVPVGPSGTKPGPTVGGWNIAVNSASDEVEVSVEVAKFLAGEEAQTIRTLALLTTPAYAAVFDNPEVDAANPILSLIKASLGNARSRPNAPDYPAMSQLIAVNFSKALAKQSAFDESLAEVEKGMQDLIK